MSRKFFGRIIEGVRLHGPYFRCKPDATGKLGFSSYKKCSAAIRMLACGVAKDLVDEYMCMSESTCIVSMYKFCRAIISVFGEEYLREPNLEDTQRLQREEGISWYAWKHRSYALGVEELSWQGQYSGHAEGCTVILEAVARQDLWIWYSFFVWQGLIMISTSSIDPLYLLGLRMAMPQQ
jgi:hypothetical protein